MTGGDDAGDGAEGGARWETYPAGAELLGMKVESFRRLAFRKAWRRIPGNDGLARVAIPLAEVEQRLADSSHGVTLGARDGAIHSARGGANLAGAEDGLVAELRRRAEAAEARTERAEDERDKFAVEVIKGRERVARAEGEVAGLRVAFEQVQGRAEWAEATTAAEREARIEAVTLARQLADQLEAAQREQA